MTRALAVSIAHNLLEQSYEFVGKTGSNETQSIELAHILTYDRLKNSGQTPEHHRSSGAKKSYPFAIKLY